MGERRTKRPNGHVRALVSGTLLSVLVLSACEDERGSPNDPDLPPPPVDSDFVFATTVVSSAIFRFQNAVIDTLVRVKASDHPLPYVIPATFGTGNMTVLNDPGPGEYLVTFTAYNDPFVDVILAAINGSMVVVLPEISPGLQFTINPGEEDVTFPQEHFVVYQLPDEFDGASLRVSGSLTGVASASGLRHAGYAHEAGTLRIDEFTQQILIVEEVAVEFEYDPEITPSFISRWPLGSYEAGFFLLGASNPISITFDGNGGASFPYRGGVCNVNLEDIEFGNSCAGT